MKKHYALIGVLALTLMLSACATDQYNGTDSNSPQDNSLAASNSEQTIPTSIETNNLNTTEPQSATTSEPVTTNNMDRTIGGQEDLFKTYSGAIIKTSEGNIEVKFYPESPITVNNFMNLAKQGFYNGTKFHRVIKDFMIQGGDPLSKGTDTSVYGTGGPEYRFDDEFNNHKLVLGSLAMANAGPGTNGSQFFIVTAESTPWLDGHHTNFGEVVKGLELVKEIGNTETNARDLPTKDIVIKSVELIK